MYRKIEIQPVKILKKNYTKIIRYSSNLHFRVGDQKAYYDGHTRCTMIIMTDIRT